MSTATANLTEERLTPEEAAQFLRTTVEALKTRRSRGKGPPYVKDGERVLYLRADLEEHVRKGRVDPEAEQETPAIVADERDRKTRKQPA